MHALTRWYVIALLAALVGLLMIAMGQPAKAAEVRLGPAAGAAFLIPDGDGDVQNVGAIGAGIEVLAPLDVAGKNWLGFGGGYDGTRLGAVGVKWLLGLGTPEWPADEETYAGFPFYMGLSLKATFLDPSSADLGVSELTIMGGPGLSFEVPIPGTETFNATLGVSYQRRLSGDERYSALVPVVLDIPATF